MFDFSSTTMNTTTVVSLATFAPILIILITLAISFYWKRNVIRPIVESPQITDDVELRIQTPLPTLPTNEQLLTKSLPIPGGEIVCYEIPLCPIIPPPTPPVDTDSLSVFPRKHPDERRGRTMTKTPSFSQARLEASASVEHFLPSLHQFIIRDENLPSNAFTSSQIRRQNGLKTIEEN
jgi:hypothetical protein